MQTAAYRSTWRGLGWLGAIKLHGDNPRPAKLNEAGNWTWVTGKEWDYHDWKPGEPSNKTFLAVKMVSNNFLAFH